MDGNVLMYISKYITNKHIDVSSKEAFVVCSYIDKSKKLKDYSAKEIQNGDADHIIEVLIEQYIKRERGDVIDYSFLAKYIETLLVSKYSFLYNLMSRGQIDECIKNMVSKNVDLTQKDFSKYVDGSYDQVFINGCESTITMNISECVVSVTLVLHSAKIKYSDNKYLINGAVREMLKEYSKENITYGVDDNLIINKFKSYVLKLTKNIREYVEKYLNKKVLVFEIPVEMVIDCITRDVIENGKLDPELLFQKKYDKVIDEYAEYLNVSNAKNRARTYILNRVKTRANGLITEDMINEITHDVMDLLNKSRQDIYEIFSGKYDQKMDEYIERKILILSSIKDQKDKSKSKGIKHKTKKRKMEPKSLFILLLTLLTLLLGYGGYKNLKSEIEYNQQLISVKGEYDFDHYYVFADDNDFVSVDADNALRFYLSVDNNEIGSSDYKYLGFYIAYLNTGQDRLHIMDEELSIAKSRSRGMQVYASVSSSIEDNRCFLEFAMHRLYEMGYKEIKDPKYKEALDAYVYAMRNDKDVKTMNSELISSEHKEVIEEIMEKYREYSRKLMEQFLHDRDSNEPMNNATELNVVNSGRKI